MRLFFIDQYTNSEELPSYYDLNLDYHITTDTTVFVLKNEP